MTSRRAHVIARQDTHSDWFKTVPVSGRDLGIDSPPPKKHEPI
jgi:hypothetical protein